MYGFVFGQWPDKMFTMENLNVKILSIGHITHDVLQIFTEKPQQLDFTPGQATEISINKEGWQNEKRPFTFTSLPNDDYLQFTIKTLSIYCLMKKRKVTHTDISLKIFLKPI